MAERVPHWSVYTVYTVLFGPHAPRSLDNPPAQGSTELMRYVVFTDKGPESLEIGDRWEVRHVVNPLPPQAAARHYKMHPELVAREEDFCTIWMDATFVWRQSPDEFVDRAIARNYVIAGFKHPDRHRIVDEGAEIARCGLAPEAQVLAQIRAYQAFGFDTQGDPLTALTTTGLLLRRCTDRVGQFNKLWAQQIHRFTLRDQMSIDFCAWSMKIPIGHMEGNYRENPFARYLSARRTPRPARTPLVGTWGQVR